MSVFWRYPSYQRQQELNRRESLLAFGCLIVLVIVLFAFIIIK